MPSSAPAPAASALPAAAALPPEATRVAAPTPAVAPTLPTPPGRPRRADARRNYDRIIAAARLAFAATGSATSLEDVARQAGVGIGTLYRNFPNRQALLEAVYIGEVQQLSRSAEDVADDEPWDGLRAWLQRVVGYLAAKHAFVDALCEYVDRDAPLFRDCRAVMYAAGEPLLARAQAAGEVRSDVTLAQILQMVMGITKMTLSDPGATEHLTGIALDGLRYRPSGAA